MLESIKLLQDFAKRNDFEFHSIVDCHKEGPIIYTRDNEKYVWMKPKASPNICYVAFSNTQRISDESTYSGIFSQLKVHNKTDFVSITKKDVLDKINSLFSSRQLKTGINIIDKQLVVKSNNERFVRKIFSKNMLNDDLLVFFNKFEAARLIINTKEINFVKSFEGKSLIGLYVLNQWITEPETINEMISLFNKILGNFSMD
ncbi:MAG: hypothetical protein JEY97_09715 [Bacteroidales bacterium]|nr:hypothetical protein [Bacteroidales bacterium]